MKFGNQIDMWSSLKRLGGDHEHTEVEWYQLLGRDRGGGYSSDIFSDATALECVIRPWQRDVESVSDEGQSGHTPGFKLYASADSGLARNDRIHWDGGVFRVVNPQHDQFQSLTRWDIRTDERDLVQIGDLDITEDDLEAPDRDTLGGY